MELKHFVNSKVNHRLLVICRQEWLLRRVSTQTVAALPNSLQHNIAHKDEYTSTPQYPPLFKQDRLGRQRFKRENWYDKIKGLPSVEEKLLEISYGFFKHDKPQRVCILEGFSERYNTLPLRQNCTRTHLVQGLPLNVYDDQAVCAVTEQMKPTILEAIRVCFSKPACLEPDDINDNFTLLRQDRLNGERMIDSMLRAITLLAGSQHGRHLVNCQMDLRPRCEAFWLKGGYPPDLLQQAIRKSVLKKYPERSQPKDPIDIWFQYIGKPYLQIRSELPLPEFVDVNDPLCTAIEVPEFPYDPRAVGYSIKQRYATAVPGVWPSDPFRFGHLSFHTREMSIRNEALFGKAALQDALHGQGIIASFGWLASLAANNGFTPFQELTYPLTTQTVITNGRQWSFYAYQLNTLAMGMDFDAPVNPMETPRVPVQNVCWATDQADLFETVQDDNVIGFNDSVLRTIVSFVLKNPLDKVDFNLRPYVATDRYNETDFANTVKSLEHRYANRPPSNRIRETPLYEKIYKIKFAAKLE